MKALMIGDVFGRPGVDAVKYLVPKIRDQQKVSFVVANCENAADGKGITPEHVREILDSGVDVITLGNHFRDQRSIDSELQNNPHVLRPNNYDDVPGTGSTTLEVGSQKISVINLIGKVHMGSIRSPFENLENIIEKMRQISNIILVDFHAEATSEKRTMGFFLNGKVTAVVGTHTHVPTADEQILSEGTAYITDLGMTGPYDSVIGLDKEVAIARIARAEKRQFHMATNDVRLSGAIIEIDSASGKATSIERIQIPFGNGRG